MSENFHSLLPIYKERLERETIREVPDDTTELFGLPYPYVTPGPEKGDALYYWDTFFINMGLLRFKLIDLARHHAENLVYLQRKLGHVPVANLKSKRNSTTLPMLPWIVRDIYRATGDKVWLSRVLPDVVHEFNYWTDQSHKTPVGLYRFAPTETDAPDPSEPCWIRSTRFEQLENYNPIDLNALLYRNALLIYDLQIEADGQGDQSLLQKSDKIKRRFDLFWDDQVNFYFDNDYVNKQLNPVKSLSGFMPLFVKMADEKHAEKLQSHIRDFMVAGGVTLTDQAYTEEQVTRAYPLLCAPFVYFLCKGLSDYEFMEDAADIGSNWLKMVFKIYKKTDQLWEWYNTKDQSITSPNDVKNSPVLGWTLGVYTALLDTLGIE